MADALTYTALTVGLIIGGGFVLAPALYLTTLGELEFGFVVLAVLAAAWLTDSFWYWVGRFITKERLYKIPFIQRRLEKARAFSDFYSQRSVWMVVFAKFVFGTRIASQLLAGLYRLPYLHFLGAVTLGALLWTAFLYILVRFVSVGLESILGLTQNIQLSLLMLVLLVAAIHLVTGTYIRKYWVKKAPHT